jgi:hypothetical protein
MQTLLAVLRWYKWLFAILLATSCQSLREASQADDCDGQSAPPLGYRLTRISVPVAGGQYQYGWTFLYEGAGKEWFYGYDERRHQIDVVDLVARRYLPSIPLAKEGPNRLVKLWDLYVHSPDSIFIHTNEARLLYLINGQGQLVDKWKFDLSPGGEGTPVGFAVARGNRGGVRCIFHAPSNQMYYQLDMAGYEQNPGEKPLLATYHLGKRSFTRLFGHYPPHYLQAAEAYHNDNAPFAVMSNGDVWVSFWYDHRLYHYPVEADRPQAHCAQSGRLPAKFKTYQRKLSSDAIFAIFEENFHQGGFYGGLLADRQKGLLYRLAKHPQPPQNAQGHPNRYFNAPWSVIVMDSQGRVVGETQPLPAGVYDFNYALPCRQGLLLSREHNPANPNNAEEMLEFDLLEIVRPNK